MRRFVLMSPAPPPIPPLRPSANIGQVASLGSPGPDRYLCGYSNGDLAKIGLSPAPQWPCWPSFPLAPSQPIETLAQSTSCATRQAKPKEKSKWDSHGPFDSINHLGAHRVSCLGVSPQYALRSASFTDEGCDAEQGHYEYVCANDP